MGKQSTLKELKRQADIVEIISRRIRLTRAGNSYNANCPFHQEKTPSFHVFPDRQSWRCFGACARGGDVINFLMRFEALTFGEACRKLVLQFGTAQADHSGGRLGEWTRDHGRVSLADDQAGGRASQFPNRTAFSDIVREHAAEGTDDIVEFHRRRVERLEQAFDVNSLDADQLYELIRRRNRGARRSSLSGLYRRDRRPVVDNLAYPRGFGRLDGPRVNRDQQPGLVIAAFFNLQPHLKLEWPGGLIALVDTAAYADGGEVIWAERGTGILKSLDTGEHYSEEVEIKGITTKGFCLLRPPGQRDYTWMAPREPEELGGQNRPTYLPDGNNFRMYALESFNIDAAILTQYEDISGLVVKLQDPERSSRRHRDHLGLGH